MLLSLDFFIYAIHLLFAKCLKCSIAPFGYFRYLEISMIAARPSFWLIPLESGQAAAL